MPDRLADIYGFHGISEAKAGASPTHVVKRQDTDEVIFRGTESQCIWVKDGYDIDLRTGHPDAVGETYIEIIRGGGNEKSSSS